MKKIGIALIIIGVVGLALDIFFLYASLPSPCSITTGCGRSEWASRLCSACCSAAFSRHWAAILRNRIDSGDSTHCSVHRGAALRVPDP